MISLQGVNKRFGRAVAVDGLTIEVPTGDSVALWGSNGAGKTTLIRCVLGLHRFRGRITVGGHDVRRQGKRARMLIGYVPQEIALYDELSAGETVRFFARLRGLDAVDTEAVLARVGLAGEGSKRVRALSGGMRQRLALAIALLGDPPVLVLDEVTASLDACGRAEFLKLLTDLSGNGRTVLFASHRVEEVAALARRVVVLERGRVTRVATAGEFASGQSLGAVLHLMIPEPSRAAAIASLGASGYPATLNGVGVLVPVATDQKAGPLRVLAEARIRVDDFEVLALPPHHPAARMEAHS